MIEILGVEVVTNLASVPSLEKTSASIEHYHRRISICFDDELRDNPYQSAPPPCCLYLLYSAAFENLTLASSAELQELY